MKNNFIILCSLVLLSCSALTSADFRCKQGGVVAPNWTCNPTYKGMYTEIGVSSKDDVILRSKEAMLLAREGSLYSKGYYWDEYTNWKHCN